MKKNRCVPFFFQGNSVIKLLVYIPAILLLLIILIVVFYEGRKAYWDYKVEEMCKKDGGLKLYESVAIDRTQFTKWGGRNGILGVPHESDNRLDVPFFRRTEEVVLRDWNPRVRRDETYYIRRQDGKSLGRYVYYSRVGGDLPSWAHSSSFGCEKPKVIVERKIFKIKEESK